MSQLIQVTDGRDNDTFYISIDESQFKFLRWLEDNSYLNKDVFFMEKEKIDEIYDLTK